MRNRSLRGYAQMFAPGERGTGYLKALGPTTDSPGEIWLYDAIDAWADDWWGGVSASMLVEALQSMSGPLVMHVNSPGGDVFEALAMYSTLKNYPGAVEVRVEGLAASAASYLALAADTTVIEPNAMMMIHEAWGFTRGPAAEMRKAADVLDKTSGNIASIYQAKAGGDVADWRAAMLEETWYTGQEAVDAGLADAVTTNRAASDPAGEGLAAARWDLAVFAHAPGAARHTPVTGRHPITANKTHADVTSINDHDQGADGIIPAGFLAALKGLTV